MNNDIVSRLQEFMNLKSLNSSTLAKELGYKSSEKLSRLFRDKNAKLSYDIIYDIANKFEINGDWLITGRGDMCLSSSNTTTSLDTKNIDLYIDNFAQKNGVLIPIYNAEASAGGGTLRLDKEYIIGHIMVPFAKKGDIALTTIGNSMLPVITPGDILVVRQRFDWKEYLEPGKIYVIVTTEEVFVKVISSFSQKLTLHSYNPQYEDFTVPESYVHAIFKLIGTISAKSY